MDMGIRMMFVFLVCFLLSGSCFGDNPPLVEFGPPSGYAIVYEDVPIGTSLFAIVARDSDSSTVTIEGDSSNRETADLVEISRVRHTGDTWSADVLLRARLDRDRAPNVRNLVFVVSDGSNRLSGSVHLIIRDVNDNPPFFVNLPYRVSIPENTAVGQSVFAVTATDPDDGPGGSVRYSMTSTDDRYNSTFLIADQNPGVITLNEPLDYESRPFYRYMVHSQDIGNPTCPGPGCKCSSITEPNVNCAGEPASFVVSVEDVQDTPPFFQRLFYIASVRENASIGTSVIQVEAFDGDLGMPNDIGYSLAGGNHLPFAIDRTTGVITVARDLSADLPESRTYTLTVTATEVEKPNAVQLGETSATAKVYISVTFANGDVPPCFELQSSGGHSEIPVGK